MGGLGDLWDMRSLLRCMKNEKENIQHIVQVWNGQESRWATEVVKWLGEEDQKLIRGMKKLIMTSNEGRRVGRLESGFKKKSGTIRKQKQIL